MADSKDDDDNKLIWVIGTAAVTALVVFQVNKYMREKESLSELKALDKVRAQLPA
jgi:hypothetical protein